MHPCKLGRFRVWLSVFPRHAQTTKRHIGALSTPRLARIPTPQSMKQSASRLPPSPPQVSKTKNSKHEEEPYPEPRGHAGRIRPDTGEEGEREKNEDCAPQHGQPQRKPERATIGATEPVNAGERVIGRIAHREQL